MSYYPGEANLRMADVVVINKMDSATAEQLKVVGDNIPRLAPKAVVVEADSELTLDGEIRGRKVLVVEDGPTLTHGEMQIGAAMVAARRSGRARSSSRGTRPSARSPRPIASTPRSARASCRQWAIPSSKSEIWQATINAINADIVLSGTPIDLKRIITVNKPVVRVRYDLKPRQGSLGLLDQAIQAKVFGQTP